MTGRAWLLLTATDRQHGGNDGYDDDPDSSYTWDDTVPNRDGPGGRGRRGAVGQEGVPRHVGDRDPRSRRKVKSVHRCPSCHRTNIKRRRSLKPAYRCVRCHHEFDVPDSEEKKVYARTRLGTPLAGRV